LGFNSRFFIALLVVCIAKGAWANCVCDDGGCGVNEYCKRVIEVDHGHAVSSTECTPCPTGSVPANSCNLCEVSNVCDGYDDPCPAGTPTGAKCKENTTTCPSPCSYYEICYPWLPATQMEELVIGACHIENDTCYSNTRACRDFSSLVYNFGQVTCLTQSGNAGWNSGKWDVSGCSCDVPSVSNNLNDYFRCTQFGTHVGLYPNQNVQSVDNSILYMMDRLYCEKCPAGYLPTITDASSEDIYLRPDNNGNWGVITCGIQVQAPDYAPGCVIDFNLSMDDMMAECRKPCPDGFATESDGATNVEDCQYDGHTRYTDDTGTFYIGSLDDCP